MTTSQPGQGKNMLIVGAILFLVDLAIAYYVLVYLPLKPIQLREFIAVVLLIPSIVIMARGKKLMDQENPPRW